MAQRTGLYDLHLEAGARIVEFGGWDMPLHYGSQIDEHHAVRKAAGMFDVSHMTVVNISGADAKDYLRRLLANDVAKLGKAGKGLYSCMLNETGGVVDDLIVYLQSDDTYRVIVNAATRANDLQWMQTQAENFTVEIRELEEKVMLAVQGPTAKQQAAAVLAESLRDAALALKPFESLTQDGLFVACTGYTGEDGWELVCNVATGRALWSDLVAAGIAPCGLGARDTLRLEAGLNLYGQDMTTTETPLESGLGWTVAWEPAERLFVGRAALEQQRAAGDLPQFVGLLLEERGVMRAGQIVHTDAGEGLITSGGFSPSIETSIGLARLPAAASGPCEVQIRAARRRARIVGTSFVRNGKILIKK